MIKQVRIGGKGKGLGLQKHENIFFVLKIPEILMGQKVYS